nr:MAG TPA: NinG protein [Caudoviricetes sp.]
MVERKCRWCGKPLPDGCHHLTRYCSDECRLAGQKEQKDKYREGSLDYYYRNREKILAAKKKQRAERRKGQNGRTCIICGRALTGRQVYVCCPTCQAAREKRRYGSLHYRPTGETTENLIEITRSAEQCGMSYGKYVAAMAAKGARK